MTPTPDEMCERLLDAADERLCLVWYSGHPLPLVGVPMDDRDGGYVLRGAPYGDSIVFEIDAVLPFALIQQQQATIERPSAALTPSADTKAAYIGEFKFMEVVGFDEDGHEIRAEITVPWDTTKEIMAAIKARAALGKDEQR